MAKVAAAIVLSLVSTLGPAILLGSLYNGWATRQPHEEIIVTGFVGTFLLAAVLTLVVIATPLIAAKVYHRITEDD